MLWAGMMYVSEMTTVVVLWISGEPTIWLLAEQDSSTVRVIKCPSTCLSRGDLEVALKIYVTGRWPILVILGIIT